MFLKLLKKSVENKFFPIVPIIDTIPVVLLWIFGDFLGFQGRSRFVMSPNDYGGIINYIMMIGIISFLFLYTARILGFNVNIIGRLIIKKLIHYIENHPM